MHKDHFWYHGRYHFLLSLFRKFVVSSRDSSKRLDIIDLGAGTGEWAHVLRKQNSSLIDTLAVGDSSVKALRALDGNDEGILRCQVDVTEMIWKEEWDVVFLLDVIEHIEDDVRVLGGMHTALRKGGTLVLSVPALMAFWSYNDEIVHHKRRYSRREIIEKAKSVGFEILDVRYYMFLLSPLVWLSRKSSRKTADLTEQQMFELLRRTHRVPNRFVNSILKFVLRMEASIGSAVPLPWGTSAYAVLRKSAD